MLSDSEMSVRASIYDVIESNVCVGCGACAVLEPSIKMERDKFGVMRPDISLVSRERMDMLSAICPFSRGSASEDNIGAELFPHIAKFDRRTGAYINTYAGRVVGGENVALSSSGGLTSWICIELMRNGLIDGVIHVGANSGEQNGLFAFQVSTTIEQIRDRRKSQYYSASFDTAVRSVLGDGKRYAFIGVPCYVKAIRLLCRADAGLRKQIKFAIALVCGHMKSASFAELLAWQVGVPPNELRAVDFRVKVAGKPAHDYDFSAVGLDGQPHSKMSSSLYGGVWGHATFQLDACDYCDDIFGETADLCLGDAWLGRYAKEWQGTNVAITRNEILEALLQSGKLRDALFLEALSIEDLVESQAGNFRHRWDGLSVRLQDAVATKRWLPVKRIKAGSRLVDKKRVAIVRLRQRMASASHIHFLDAKVKGSLQYYRDQMSEMVHEMEGLSRPSFAAVTLRKLKTLFRRFSSR